MQPIHIHEIPLEIREYLQSINSIKFPKQGYTSNVGIIESNRGFYALKRASGEQYRSWLNKEVAVLKCLTKWSSLPIPAVKKFVEQTSENQSWALFEMIEGVTLRTALINEENQEKRHELIFNFGRILYQIHSTPCPSELKYDQPWLNHMLDRAEYHLNNYEVDGSGELLEEIKRNQPINYKQALIHGDFTIDNVLVSNGAVTGVIDWSGGAYGDPRYDVSLAIRPKPNAFENEVDKEIFFEGYGDRIINDKEYDYFVNGLYEFF